MKIKLVIISFIVVFISKAVAETPNPDGLLKEVEKSKQYIKSAEWIDENKFLILIKPVLSSSDFPEVFAKTCSVAKKKFFIKGFEIQLAKKIQ